MDLTAKYRNALELLRRRSLQIESEPGKFRPATYAAPDDMPLFHWVWYSDLDPNKPQAAVKVHESQIKFVGFAT